MIFHQHLSVPQGRERVLVDEDSVFEVRDLRPGLGVRPRVPARAGAHVRPDVLVLDEPTNGLDPPQIREMRQVLQDYAATGRTVVVSSHLLSEVEQTCSHVVVMHRGTLIAKGTVTQLLAGRSGARLEDVFMEIVGRGHEVVTS